MKRILILSMLTLGILTFASTPRPAMAHCRTIHSSIASNFPLILGVSY